MDPSCFKLSNLEEEDIRPAPAYAAWRVKEVEVPLPGARSS